MHAKEITETIKKYMQCDTIGLQALVLHGEWGSGKTYYCENDLKPALKELGIKVCRVSLFGVSDYDEICNRVLASWLHFPKTQRSALMPQKMFLRKAQLTLVSQLQASG